METDPVLATVIAIFALLLIGAAAAIGFKRIQFPFTVGLVLVGLALGALQPRFEALEFFSSFSLSPDLILFVFLPTLIFESAFNLDVRLLSRNIAPVLGLAAPGLVLSTVIVGALIQFLTPVTWGPALVFGALISATDPVAVIALFKDVGAPKRLTVLVEGESLFNDATAIVLFTILVSVVEVGTFGGDTISNGMVQFVRVFVGGLGVGIGIGYLMVRTIAFSQDDPIVEVALSTVVAYAAFIAAEHYLHVSGVMATVGAGVVVGTYGSTRFSAELKAYLHQFWEYAAFVANSLIFLLVGLTVDLGNLASFAVPIGLAIAAVLVARSITVFGLVPIINRFPNAEPVDAKYQAIMFWGGLRGAVALALALSLPETFPFRDFVVALSIGIVLFTLLAGGLTMKPLIHLLGLDALSPVERIAHAQGNLVAKRAALARVDSLATAGHYSGRIIGELQDLYGGQLEQAEADIESLCAAPGLRGDTMRQVLMTQAFSAESHTYRESFERGQISEAVLHELDLSVDMEREALKRGEIYELLPFAEPLEVRVTGWWIRLLERFAPASGPVQRHRIRSLAARYERDTAVLAATDDAMAAIDRVAELAHVAGDIQDACRQIYQARAAKAMTRIDSVSEHFPEYAMAVQERTAQRIALDAEADAVKQLAEAGGIPKSVARDAKQQVTKALRQLARKPVTAVVPDPAELLTKVPFFKELSPDDFARVAQKLIPRTVLPHEDIIVQGERGTSLFLIARGVVSVLVRIIGVDESRRIASLHAGDFFGEMALLSDEPRSATVHAITACQLYELSKQDVDALCEVCKGVGEALAEAARDRAEARLKPRMSEGMAMPPRGIEPLSPP